MTDAQRAEVPGFGARRRGSLRALGIFAVTLAAYVPAALHRRREADIYMASLEGWRIASAHTPWFTHEIVAQIPHTFRFELGPGPDGQVLAHRSPGVVLAAIPGYVLAHTGDAVSAFTLVPTAITAALLAAISVTLLFLTLTRRTSPTTAVLGTLAFALATPMWVINGSGLWTHNLTVLGICGMAWAAERERWIVVGLFATVAIWGRVHTVLIVAILGVGLAWSHRDKVIALKVAIVSIVGTLAASLWTHWLYGSWFPSGGYTAGTYTSMTLDRHGEGLIHYSLVNQLGLWVSPGRGLLVWTPIIVVLTAAVIRNWRDLPPWSQWLAIGGFAYTLVQGELNGFSGGNHFYGYRLPLELLTCLAPALILSVRRAGGMAKRLLAPVLSLQFAVMALGALSGGAGLDEKRAWTDNVFWQVCREAPGVIVPLTVIAMGIAWLAARIIRKNTAGQEPVRSSEQALAATPISSSAAAALEPTTGVTHSRPRTRRPRTGSDSAP